MREERKTDREGIEKEGDRETEKIETEFEGERETEKETEKRGNYRDDV